MQYQGFKTWSPCRGLESDRMIQRLGATNTSPVVSCWLQNCNLGAGQNHSQKEQRTSIKLM